MLQRIKAIFLYLQPFQIYIFSATLFLGSFILYSYDLHGAFFLDDIKLISQNEYIKEIKWQNVQGWFTENIYAGFGDITEYYRPILLISFAINYFFNALEPAFYHLFNNLLHSLNAVLVFLLFKQKFKKIAYAFFISLIFALHPIQSENVIYVSGRGDLLASFFILTGIFCWIRSFDSRHRIAYFTCSVASYILALLSRESAVVFPFLALIFYLFLNFDGREPLFFRRLLFQIMPHILITYVYFILRLTFLNFRNFLNFGYADSLYGYYLHVRILTFFHALLEYLKMMFTTLDIHERFIFPVHSNFFDRYVVGGLVVVISIIAFGFFLYRKKPSSDSLCRTDGLSGFHVWIFGWSWFFINLLPSSGILPLSIIVQDHRLYLAILGPLSIAAYYLYLILGLAHKKRHKFFVLSLVFLIIMYLSYRTFQRIIVWNDPKALLTESLSYEPDALIAMGALGEIYKREDNADRAIFYFRQAIERDLTYSLAYRNLISIYLKNGQFVEAVHFLRKLHVLNPGEANTHYFLALTLDALNQKQEALLWIDRGVGLITENQGDRIKFEELRKQVLNTSTPPPSL